MDLSSAFRIAANHLIIQINPLTRPRIIEVVLPPMLWFSLMKRTDKHHPRVFKARQP